MNKIEQMVSLFKRSRLSDIQNIEKQIKRLQNNLKQKSEEIQKHGNRYHRKGVPTKGDATLAALYNGSRKRQKKPSPVFSLNFPDEDLPEEGTTVYRKKGSRYLAIQYEDQLDQAQADASRLNAKIVIQTE